jgi:GH43 family beta-xylosidase
MFNNSGNPDLTIRENWQGVFRITNYSGWGIDPTIALINGNRYLIYSFKNDYWRDPQSLRIQKIVFDNATKRVSLTGYPQIISSPDNNWETVDLRVNEGPEFIQDPATGKMHIVYSASFSQSPEYCLGMLTLNGNGSDPMIRSNWIKSNGPVFKYQNGSGMYGTGHNCFTNVNGTWYNFFHATQTQGSQWGYRVSLAQPFTFSNTGVPQLGTPTRDPGASLAV